MEGSSTTGTVITLCQINGQYPSDGFVKVCDHKLNLILLGSYSLC